MSGASTECHLLENAFTGGEMDLPLHFKGFRNNSYRVVKECIERFIGIGENFTCTSLRQVGYLCSLSGRVKLSRT